MTKKQYILYILNDLMDIWAFSRSLIIVVNKVEEDSKLLDDLFLLLKKNINDINDKNIKIAFNKSKNNLKKYIEQEKKDKNNDMKDLKFLEQDLDLI